MPDTKTALLDTFAERVAKRIYEEAFDVTLTKDEYEDLKKLLAEELAAELSVQVTKPLRCGDKVVRHGFPGTWSVCGLHFESNISHNVVGYGIWRKGDGRFDVLPFEISAAPEPEQTLQVTQSDLELLIKIAAREQRYACVETFAAAHPEWAGSEAATIQDAPCPSVAAVLGEWEKGANNG